MRKEAERLEEKYFLSFFTKELPICVVVPTRNNVENYRYEYNLQSILNQDYTNYKLVVVDDASNDGTGDLIDLFLARSKLPKERYALIRNKERMTAIPNIYRAITTECGRDDIAIIVSGDD